MAAAGRSLAYVAVAAILVVAVSWPFGSTSPWIDASAARVGWALLAGFFYAVLTAVTLAERGGRLRRRQATVSTEWTVHFVAQLAVLLACGLVFFRGSDSGVAMLGLDTMIAAVTTVALLATTLELIGRWTVEADVCDRGMFLMLRLSVASPARGVVLSTTTLAASLALSAALVYLEFGAG